MPLEEVVTPGVVPEGVGSGMVVASVRDEKASLKGSVIDFKVEGKVVPRLLLQNEVEWIGRLLGIREVQYKRRFEIRYMNLEVSS